MAYEALRVTTATYLKAAWALDATYPLQAENITYNPTPGKAWARWSVRPVTAVSADIGANMRRVTGMLWFQLFIPEGKGTSDADKMADQIDGILSEKRIIVGAIQAVLMFSQASLNFIGPDGTGWQIWRCLVPYRIDEIAGGANLASSDEVTSWMIIDLTAGAGVTVLTGGGPTNLDGIDILARNIVQGRLIAVTPTATGRTEIRQLQAGAPTGSDVAVLNRPLMRWRLTGGG